VLTAQRGERPAAVSAKAYDLYLRAKHICDRWVGPHADGVRLLEEAQALAPDDPRIAGRLAMELARATGAVTHPSDIALTKARAMAAHAQRLNPTRADPAVARAILHWHWSELEACVAALDDALAIDREDAEALAMLGRLLAEAGSAKEGLILLRRATVADPELATARVAIHRTLALMEDWDHAAPELGVPKPRADVGISYARGLLWRRDVEGARALVDALPAMDIAALAKNWTVGLLSPLFGPIDVERVRQALPLDVGAPSRVAFFAQLRAEAFAIGDMLELAIDSAEAADANGTLDVLWMDRCPALTAIRNEPRFVAVAARTFARAQRVHGRLLALAARIG
jgi:serine/threonine-protein kinase